MKTFSQTCVLALMLVSFGSVANANFDDDDVRDGALRIRNLSNQARTDLQNGDISVPFIQRAIFQAGFLSISQKAQQIANLSNANDEDAVEGQMLQLAREIRQAVTVLTSRAAQLDNQELLNILAIWADLSDELIDDLD